MTKCVHETNFPSAIATSSILTLAKTWSPQLLPHTTAHDTASTMSGYTPYSDVYNPPQTYQNYQDYGQGPIQPDRQGRRYSPTEDIEETARRQQMEAWNLPGARRAPLSDRNLENHRRRSTRERSADDGTAC